MNLEQLSDVEVILSPIAVPHKDQPTVDRLKKHGSTVCGWSGAAELSEHAICDDATDSECGINRPTDHPPDFNCVAGVSGATITMDMGPWSHISIRPRGVRACPCCRHRSDMKENRDRDHARTTQALMLCPAWQAGSSTPRKTSSDRATSMHNSRDRSH
jgi:hypothetical protein